MSVAFSADGTRIASREPDNTVKVWDARTGQCLETQQGHRLPFGEGRNPASSGSRTAVPAENGVIVIRNNDTDAPELTLCSLPDNQWVSYDATGRVISASPEAWRFVAWRTTDPHTGQLRLLPAEVSPLWAPVA